MSHLTDRFTVILDANVLYPFQIRDVLLSMSESGLFRARWSEEILREWTSHLIDRKPEKKDNIIRTVETMREAFPEALVTGHVKLIGSIILPDANDRHVLAAAIRADAQHIVTCNLKDFPPDVLEPYGITAISPDDFATATFELYEIEALAALREMRLRYISPALSKAEMIKQLADCGLPQLAASVKPHIESL